MGASVHGHYAIAEAAGAHMNAHMYTCKSCYKIQLQQERLQRECVRTRKIVRQSQDCRYFGRLLRDRASKFRRYL